MESIEMKYEAYIDREEELGIEVSLPCSICGRRLFAVESLRRGIGPKCWKRAAGVE